MTCDQLEKAASFLNTSGHDISDVFEPASDPLKPLIYEIKQGGIQKGRPYFFGSTRVGGVKFFEIFKDF